MPKSMAVLLPPLLALIAACAPQPAPPQAPPPPAPAPAPPPPTSAALAPIAGSSTLWNVTRVTCGQLLDAADDDRAAAIMFYYGYLAASSRIRVIDVSKIDGNVKRVMDQCVQNPDLTIPQAYRIAFHRPRRG